MTDLKDALERHGAEVVHVGQFDLASVFRERRLRKTQFLDWAEDPRFANVLAHWDINDNLFGGSRFYTETVEIDPDSIRRNPSEPGAVTMIAELSGDAKELMPRQVLRRQVERAAKMGFKVDAAFEFEVIILDEDAQSVRGKGFSGLQKFAPDNKCWSGTTANAEAAYISGFEAEVLGHDIALHGLGVELGPGCLEGTLAATEGLRAADDAAFFRLAARSYARKNGKTASFMPYLGAEYPGIGGHCCMSLRDAKNGKNLFSSPDGKTNSLAGQFIAGMMDAAGVPGATGRLQHLPDHGPDAGRGSRRHRAWVARARADLVRRPRHRAGRRPALPPRSGRGGRPHGPKRSRPPHLGRCLYRQLRGRLPRRIRKPCKSCQRRRARPLSGGMRR
ncbi:MAG: glutamine synthetase [Tabrizicola sp.]|nr:glutamine synthetase [Tabrizicola sp.]